MSQIVIRRLLPAAAPVYRALMLEAYDAHPATFSSSAAERAALPDQLIGVAGLRLQRGEKLGHKATLFGMYVRPESRQQGVGDALTRTVLAAARCLYERHRFAPFGLEPFAVRVSDGYVAQVHMWRRLDRC